MRNFLTILLLGASTIIMAQSKGTIQGKVLDKEASNESLPFANVFIKGSQTGTTTDMDGIYTFKASPGTYTIVFSFVGYQTIEVPNILVKEGEVTTLENVILGAAQGVALKEVVVKATTQKESVSALLSDQKKAVEIKTSIGAQELTNLGVSDAGTAATKISGITQSEGSGDVFIRGLGDRYLSTTMNGLPIPSDNVDKKNIDLSLFSTNVIQNIGVTKAYSVANYADQSSGSVDVVSKEAKGKSITLGINFGANTNALDVSEFKRTQNLDDLSFGFYSRSFTTQDGITQQSWNTKLQSGSPLNLGGSIALNSKINIFGKPLSVFATASHSNTFEHRIGEFRKFRSNVLDNEFTDAEQFNAKTNTTALVNLSYPLTDNIKLKYNFLAINKSNDQLYESGRNLEGFVFDQDPSEFQAFVRDQNTQVTQLFINQFLSSINISENNKLELAVGYNFVTADEPNRIRNEVNTLSPGVVEFSNVGNFQQRKSIQQIEDEEINAYIKDTWTLSDKDSTGTKLNLGINFRNRQRNLESQFVGLRARGVQVESIDNLTTAFTPAAFPVQSFNFLFSSYDGELNIIAPFASIELKFNKFSASVGGRYETTSLDLPFWDVPNFVGRTGSSFTDYNNFFPAINLKYALNEKTNLRLSASKTITLPEFKEIAPFEYNDPTGRVTVGNPDLIASTDYNFDLKYEFFPSAGQLVSVGVFYKSIEDPINTALTRGSSGNFSYFNTGEKATVFGVEVETRLDLIKQEGGANLNLVFNAAYMSHNQDLFENFQYKNITESNLQGASDFITNAGLTYTNGKENEFIATISGNYASDKIFSLGSPEDFTNSATLYNDEIIENGFTTLDLQLSKKINKHLSLRLSGKNLLDPTIRQTQKIRNLNTAIETNETVLSYKKGLFFNLGVRYTF